jgi:cytochrome c5
MGAPKPGDPRFLEDIDILVENAIKGIGNMPARGHATFLSDDEVRSVVEYMKSPN